MIAAHVRLILTHVPIIGVAFAERVALWFLVLFALIAIPLYLTGEAAEEAVEDMPGVAEAVAVALLGALVFRRRPELSPGGAASGLEEAQPREREDGD